MKFSNILITGSTLAILLYFCIPYPIVQKHYSTSEYAQNSYQQISKLQTSITKSPISAGIAKVDITPNIGVPLGGYGSLFSRRNTGYSQKVFARAITFVNNDKKVVFLNGEFLLPLPLLVDEVVKQSGLKREQVFFTATHTHSGPGGYSNKFSSEFPLGDFHPEYFNHLVAQLVKAVNLSQQNLQKVTINYQQTSLDQASSQINVPSRFDSNDSSPPHETTLHFLTINSKEKILAMIATANAHPTVYKSINTKINGDYPGILSNIMEENCQCIGIFASGSVGGNTSPALDKDLNIEQAIEKYSKNLYSIFTDDNLHSKNYRASIESINVDIIPVQLPDAVFHINENWKINPKLFKLLLHDEKTYIHVLRIGKLVFTGFPADYSEQLSNELINWGDHNNAYVWATSFNGDYVGYIMSSKQYETPNYSTRNMNFFGKWTGDYMNDLVKAYILKH